MTDELDVPVGNPADNHEITHPESRPQPESSETAGEESRILGGGRALGDRGGGGGVAGVSRRTLDDRRRRRGRSYTARRRRGTVVIQALSGRTVSESDCRSQGNARVESQFGGRLSGTLKRAIGPFPKLDAAPAVWAVTGATHLTSAASALPADSPLDTPPGRLLAHLAGPQLRLAQWKTV